jgi:D-alanyl-lipoteichoic acid acyltransferase DltB (MBOAT superfamily)
VLAPLFLHLLPPEILASSGDAVGRLRLWAWLFETSVYLWAVYSGVTDVGAGLAAMIGIRVPENFRAPWAATRPSAFWRRTLRTVGARLDRLVGRPMTRRLGAPAGLLASFVAAALWYASTVLALFGPFGSRPGAWAGLGAWALLHTSGVLAGDRLRLEDRGPAGRLLGRAATHVFVALAWVPFVAFPFGTLGTILRIYARLLGLR